MKQSSSDQNNPVSPSAISAKRFQIPREKLVDFCKKNHIRKLSLFGSVLRRDYRPDSDIDVLVEFIPGHPVGFIRLAEMELELSRIVGRKVDLRTPNDISKYFRIYASGVLYRHCPRTAIPILDAIGRFRMLS